MQEFTFCVQCGLRSPAVASFCRSCGAALVHDEPKPTSADTVKATTAPTEPSSDIDSGAKPAKTQWQIKKEPKSEGSFVGKHWRGEYPMPFALFVIGLGAGLVGFTFQATINSLDLANFSQQASGLVMLVSALSWVLLPIWYAVGVGRAAARAVRTGQGAGQGIAGAMVVAAVLSVGLFRSGLATLEVAQDGFDLFREKQFSLSVVNDGKEVIFNGFINAGAAHELREVLNASDRIELLHMESPGGSIGTAEALAQVVLDYGLKTFTRTECSSACTVIFAAGSERYLGKSAELGFHSARQLGATTEISTTGNEVMRDVLMAHGVAEAFIEQAFAYGPDEMWFPSHDELLAAGVVDAIVESTSFGQNLAAMEAITVAVVEGWLDSARVFRILKQHDPLLYKEAADALTDGYLQGRPLADVQQTVRLNYVQEIIRKYLSQAPDVALGNYFYASYQSHAHLAKTNLAACAWLAYPAIADNNFYLAGLVPREMLDGEIEALADAYQASIDDPTFDSGDRGEEAARRVFVDFQLAYPELAEVVLSQEMYRDNDEALCFSSIRFYEHLFSRERRADLGPALRYLSSVF